MTKQINRTSIPAKILKIMQQMPLEKLLVSSSDFPGHRFSEDIGDESDFREYQNYVSGEDPKRIDWKVFARSDRKVIKKFSSEKSRNVYLCLDCSASVGSQGSESFRQFFYYVMMYLYLKNERFGLILLKHQQQDTQVLKSAVGPEHFKKIEQMFFNITYEGTSELTESLRPVINDLERNSEIIYFSDFQYSLAEFKKVIDLALANMLHLNLIALFNYKMIEFTAGNEGLWLHGHETHGRNFLDKGLIKDYQHLVIEHYKQLTELAKRHNLPCNVVDSREGVLESFIKLFK